MTAMFPINSLSGALVQSAQVQIQQAAEKSRQARKQQELARNTAARDDELEHQVENSEEPTAIHEESPNSQKERKRPQHHPEIAAEEESESEGLDLQA